MRSPIQTAVAGDLPPFGGREYSGFLILAQFAGFVCADFPAQKNEKSSLFLSPAARYVMHGTGS